MKLLLIVNSAEPLEGIFEHLPHVNLQSILHSPSYDVHKLMEGAKAGDNVAEQEIKNILNDSISRKIYLGLGIVRALYANEDKVVTLDAAFLTPNDVEFISDTLKSRYHIVLVNYSTLLEEICLTNIKNLNCPTYVRKDDITIDNVMDAVFGRYPLSKGGYIHVPNGTYMEEPHVQSNLTSDNVIENGRKLASQSKLDALLDEVDDELMKMSLPIKTPENMTLSELIKHLDTEWVNDKELKTLALHEVVELLGFTLTPITDLYE